jgi:hypothetical protein
LGEDEHAEWGYPEKKVILRFHASEGQDVAAALDTAEFPVIETTQTQRSDSLQ